MVAVSPEQLEGTAEQMLGDPRSVIDENGDVIASATVNDPTDPRFDPDDIENLDRVIDPVYVGHDEAVSDRGIRTLDDAILVGGPVIKEILGDGNALTEDGDIIPIDLDQRFTPQPAYSEITDEDDPVALLIEALRRHDLGDVAYSFEKLGIGHISPADLSDPVFRAGVSEEAYAGYLFSLTKLNGNMRIKNHDLLSEGTQIPVFDEAYRLFLDGSSSDVSLVSAEAERLIREEKAFLSGITVKRADRIWAEVHRRSTDYIDRVEVVDLDGRLVLSYDENSNSYDE